MLCQNETQVVNTDNSCETFQLETFIWRQNPSTQMVEMGYENGLMYLLQEMTAVENAHYLSGRRRRNNLDGVQGLKLLS